MSVSRRGFLQGLGVGRTSHAAAFMAARGHEELMAEAIRLLTDVEGVGHVAFTKDDVVRHELVARIVEAYDNASARREAGK